MANLKLIITKANGDKSEHPVTPALKYAFELWSKKGFQESFGSGDYLEQHLYWLAWEALRSSGESVPMFGIDFVRTLADVDVEVEAPNV